MHVHAMWVVSLALLYLRPCFLFVGIFWSFPPFVRCGQLSSPFPAMGPPAFPGGTDIFIQWNR
jgi:hypothetical protein